MIVTTTYKILDISDFEEFTHNLFQGLNHYKEKNKDFSFKLTYSKDTIELKVIKLNEHVN